MKRIHIISNADSNLCDLAVLLKNRGVEISMSYLNISAEDINKLQQCGLAHNPEGWHPLSLNFDCEYIIASSDLEADNPEIQRAKELNINILTFPEYIFKKIKDKLRVIVKEPESESSIIEMIFYVLEKNNLLFDYVVNNDSDLIHKNNLCTVNWSYDTRMAVIENNTSYSSVVKKPVNEYFRPHILVLSSLKDEEADSYRKLLSSIEKNGKLIYNENDTTLLKLAETVRDDITAIPFTQHKFIEDNSGCQLQTRFGNYKINYTTKDFLINLNAARITCRHMGVKDQDFYKAISEYSFQ